MDVVHAVHFLDFDAFKVVGVDVVPELAEEGVVGVVLDVGLLVGDLEVEAALGEDGGEEIDSAIVKADVPTQNIPKMEVAVLGINPDQLLQQRQALRLPSGPTLLAAHHQ